MSTRIDHLRLTVKTLKSPNAYNRRSLMISQNHGWGNGLETVLSVFWKYERTPRESTSQILRELHHFTRLRFNIAIKHNRGHIEYLSGHLHVSGWQVIGYFWEAGNDGHIQSCQARTFLFGQLLRYILWRRARKFLLGRLLGHGSFVGEGRLCKTKPGGRAWG